MKWGRLYRVIGSWETDLSLVKAPEGDDGCFTGIQSNSALLAAIDHYSKSGHSQKPAMVVVFISGVGQTIRVWRNPTGILEGAVAAEIHSETSAHCLRCGALLVAESWHCDCPTCGHEKHYRCQHCHSDAIRQPPPIAAMWRCYVVTITEGYPVLWQVESCGEGPAVGLYLRLRHIETATAHCDDEAPKIKAAERPVVRPSEVIKVFSELPDNIWHWAEMPEALWGATE